MLMKQLTGGTVGGGNDINLLNPDLTFTGYATSNSAVSHTVAKKPRLIISVYNGSNTQYPCILQIIDVEKGLYSRFLRYNGTYSTAIEQPLSNDSVNVSITDSTVSINYYSEIGGQSPYYRTNIYY